jgi:hypothetical protein
MHAHPYLHGAVIRPVNGDPTRFEVLLAPSWQDLDIAVDAALDAHDGIAGAFDLASYLPKAYTLPDWEMPSAARGVWYSYPFSQIELDHVTGRLKGNPIRSLLAS